MYSLKALIVLLSINFLVLNINTQIEEIEIPDELIKTLFSFAPNTNLKNRVVPHINNFIHSNGLFIKNYNLKFVAQAFNFNEMGQEIFKYFIVENDKDISNLFSKFKFDHYSKIIWYFMIDYKIYQDHLQKYEINSNIETPEPNVNKVFPESENLDKTSPEPKNSVYYSDSEISPEVPQEIYSGYLTN